MAQRVMLIDDDEGYLLAVRRMLEGAGYEVSTASGPAEARRQLESHRPDLILLDVIMPAADGLTFAEELADNKAIEGVPVVLVTAVAEVSGQTMYAFEQGKGLTAADILPKSEVHDRLLECVASALGGKEQTAASESGE